jgi:hypothetical protein
MPSEIHSYIELELPPIDAEKARMTDSILTFLDIALNGTFTTISDVVYMVKGDRYLSTGHTAMWFYLRLNVPGELHDFVTRTVQTRHEEEDLLLSSISNYTWPDAKLSFIKGGLHASIDGENWSEVLNPSELSGIMYNISYTEIATLVNTLLGELFRHE